MAWFLAELVVEMRIDKELLNVVHVNSHLIRAKSDIEAAQKAKAIGKEYSYSYKNTDGKKVKVHFRGIRSLFELLDGVKDGAEILWEEHVGMKEEKIKSWLNHSSKKEKINKSIPNYMPEDVMKKLEDAGFDRKELMKKK